MQNSPSDTNQTGTQDQKAGQVPDKGLGAGVQKEVEPTPKKDAQLKEVIADIELKPELTKVGVEKRSETIELPPDVQKMGVQAVGPSQPAIPTTSTSLPLTDDQIVQGLHAQVLTSFRWLAEWCVRQLKKVHIHLQKVHGKITRVAD